MLDGCFDNEAVGEHPSPLRRPRRVGRHVKSRGAEWKRTAASAAAARGLGARILLRAAEAKNKEKVSIICSRVKRWERGKGKVARDRRPG